MSRRAGGLCRRLGRLEGPGAERVVIVEGVALVMGVSALHRVEPRKHVASVMVGVAAHGVVPHKAATVVATAALLSVAAHGVVPHEAVVTTALVGIAAHGIVPHEAAATALISIAAERVKPPECVIAAAKLGAAPEGIEP